MKNLYELENYVDCIGCTKKDCPHRNAFRRLPRELGGLGLCPGKETKQEVKEEVKA